MRDCPKCASPMELVFQKNKEGKPSAFYICEDCGYEVEGEIANINATDWMYKK